MANLRIIIAGLALIGLLVPLWDSSLEATLKYKRETGKRCLFCHTDIPEPGDEDPLLNEDGKKFQENNNQLTEEQKRRPD